MGQLLGTPMQEVNRSSYNWLQKEVENLRVAEQLVNLEHSSCTRLGHGTDGLFCTGCPVVNYSYIYNIIYIYVLYCLVYNIGCTFVTCTI